jgi:hypothetical protein
MSLRRLAAVVLVIFICGGLGFVFRDVGIGRTVGVGIALWIVLSVACRAPRKALVSAPRADGRLYLLAVVCPIADAAAAAARIKASWAERKNPEDTVVRLVVPIRCGVLDRWSSAVDGARAEARRKLQSVTAGLAEAGIAVEASIGDEDVVQAVEDEISLFPATEVILFTGFEEEAAKVRRTAEELRSRLVAYFRHVHVGVEPAQRGAAPGPDHPAYRPRPALPTLPGRLERAG